MLALPSPRSLEGTVNKSGYEGQRSEASCGVAFEASYARRSAVPRQVWHRMFAQAKENIDVLAYSGLFIAGDSEAMRILMAKVTGGVRVRVLLGDPDSENIIRHGADESGDVSAEIRKALTLYHSLDGLGSMEIRLHRTALYASIFRGDDDLLVNPHVHGAMPARSPVIHLGRNRGGGDAARAYLEGFESIWVGSRW
jgi:hypothetical protein